MHLLERLGKGDLHQINNTKLFIILLDLNPSEIGTIEAPLEYRDID